MRIALTCDWFLKYAAAQSAALAKAGAEVLLLCRAHPHEFGGDTNEWTATVENARRSGVTVVVIPGRFSDLRVGPKLIGTRRRLARFRPDVVHAHDGADPRALALLPRVPTVLTIHDPVPHPGQPAPGIPRRWLLSASRRAWRARADVITVHSEHLRSAVRLRGAQGCAVIPHGLHMVAEPLPPPARRAVSFFGRLTPYKGLDVLARAMPRVWEMRPDIELHVAGAGASALGLDDGRVKLERAYLPEAGIEHFFRTASLSVLPYTQASQTGAGSVALGYGVPIIVSRVGGLPDLALDQSYVVDPGDPAGLASAIVQHVDDGLDVRHRVLTELARPRSWDAVAAETLALYRQLAVTR